jgi:hypothetical protein
LACGSGNGNANWIFHGFSLEVLSIWNLLRRILICLKKKYRKEMPVITRFQQIYALINAIARLQAPLGFASGAKCTFTVFC